MRTVVGTQENMLTYMHLHHTYSEMTSTRRASCQNEKSYVYDDCLIDAMKRGMQNEVIKLHQLFYCHLFR